MLSRVFYKSWMLNQCCMNGELQVSVTWRNWVYSKSRPHFPKFCVPAAAKNKFYLIQALTHFFMHKQTHFPYF